jgi:hypothetical protein
VLQCNDWCPARDAAEKLAIRRQERVSRRSSIEQRWGKRKRIEAAKQSRNTQTPVLSRRVAKNVFAVGVKAHAPQAHARHELLRLFQLAVAPENRLDKLATAVLAHGNGLLLAALLLGRLPHVVFAHLEQLGKANPQALATLEEVFDHFGVLSSANLVHDLLSALDLASELDQKQPEFAGHLGDGGGGSVVEDGPVVDPLAERVGIEDTTEQHDGFFSGVPVLVRVSSGDLCAAGILFGGLCGSLGGGALGGGSRLRATGGVGGATGPASLWLWIVDWDLIMTITISIPVTFVSRVLLVRRRWVSVDIIVDIVVVCVSVPVGKDCVDRAHRFGRATLLLAMGALERMGICVATRARRTHMTVTVIETSTYIFGGASRRRISACRRVAVVGSHGAAR